MSEEIEFLIGSIGKDNCSLVRNDRRLSDRNAREHLRSKRQHNAHLIDNTEDFIAKIASKSATTGESYLIICPGEQPQTSAVWFTDLLEQHRNSRPAQ